MKTLIFPLLALLACLTSCATSQSVTTGTTQLSRDLVEKSLVNGKTTKAEVAAMLGEPQTTVSSTGGSPYSPAETWSYMKTFRRDPSEKGLAYGVAYNIATGSQYDRIEVSVLMVMFDAKGHVMRHIFSTSTSGTRR